MRSDSLASSGEALARMRTYNAAKGWRMGINPPAIARLTIMIENSPRAKRVNPVLRDATGDKPARRPTIKPAAVTPIRERTEAPTASHAEPPKVNGSIDRPKPKKKKEKLRLLK